MLSRDKYLSYASSVFGVIGIKVVQFSSVAQSCPTLCDPMNHSTPGLPVHHQLPEYTQTQVHRVGDAIQPSHPLSSPFPPAPNPSQQQSLFQWVNSSHEVMGPDAIIFVFWMLSFKPTFSLSSFTFIKRLFSIPAIKLVSYSFLLCLVLLISIQFSSVAQSCPTLCNPMNHSTPGLPVHHQLPEYTQTHVHRVRDAIQPSHPLSSPSPPAPNPSQHQSLFQWVNSWHQVAKVLEFQL